MAKLGCACCHAASAQASSLHYRLSGKYEKLRGSTCSGRKVQLARQRHISVHCSDDYSSHDASHSDDSSLDSSHSSGSGTHDTSHSSSYSHHHSSDKHQTEDGADKDSYPQDNFLHVVSMFDAGDSDAVSYQPSSGQYNKQPGLPASSDFWAYKPVWCQPWSILASGTAFIAGVRWIFGGSNIATGVAAVPVLVWWYLFLVLVPADFRKYAEKE